MINSSRKKRSLDNHSYNEGDESSQGKKRCLAEPKIVLEPLRLKPNVLQKLKRITNYCVQAVAAGKTDTIKLSGNQKSANETIDKSGTDDDREKGDSDESGHGYCNRRTLSPSKILEKENENTEYANQFTDGQQIKSSENGNSEMIYNPDIVPDVSMKDICVSLNLKVPSWLEKIEGQLASHQSIDTEIDTCEEKAANDISKTENNDFRHSNNEEGLVSREFKENEELVRIRKSLEAKLNWGSDFFVENCNAIKIWEEQTTAQDDETFNEERKGDSPSQKILGKRLLNIKNKIIQPESPEIEISIDADNLQQTNRILGYNKPLEIEVDEKKNLNDKTSELKIRTDEERNEFVDEFKTEEETLGKSVYMHDDPDIILISDDEADLEINGKDVELELDRGPTFEATHSATLGVTTSASSDFKHNHEEGKTVKSNTFCLDYRFRREANQVKEIRVVLEKLHRIKGNEMEKQGKQETNAVTEENEDLPKVESALLNECNETVLAEVISDADVENAFTQLNIFQSSHKKADILTTDECIVDAKTEIVMDNETCYEDVKASHNKGENSATKYTRMQETGLLPFHEEDISLNSQNAKECAYPSEEKSITNSSNANALNCTSVSTASHTPVICRPIVTNDAVTRNKVSNNHFSYHAAEVNSKGSIPKVPVEVIPDSQKSATVTQSTGFTPYSCTEQEPRTSNNEVNMNSSSNNQQCQGPKDQVLKEVVKEAVKETLLQDNVITDLTAKIEALQSENSQLKRVASRLIRNAYNQSSVAVSASSSSSQAIPCNSRQTQIPRAAVATRLSSSEVSLIPLTAKQPTRECRDQTSLDPSLTHVRQDFPSQTVNSRYPMHFPGPRLSYSQCHLGQRQFSSNQCAMYNSPSAQSVPVQSTISSTPRHCPPLLPHPKRMNIAMRQASFQHQQSYNFDQWQQPMAPFYNTDIVADPLSSQFTSSLSDVSLRNNNFGLNSNQMARQVISWRNTGFNNNNNITPSNHFSAVQPSWNNKKTFSQPQNVNVARMRIPQWHSWMGIDTFNSDYRQVHAGPSQQSHAQNENFSPYLNNMNSQGNVSTTLAATYHSMQQYDPSSAMITPNFAQPNNQITSIQIVSSLPKDLTNSEFSNRNTSVSQGYQQAQTINSQFPVANPPVEGETTTRSSQTFQFSVNSLQIDSSSSDLVKASISEERDAERNMDKFISQVVSNALNKRSTNSRATHPTNNEIKSPLASKGIEEKTRLGSPIHPNLTEKVGQNSSCKIRTKNTTMGSSSNTTLLERPNKMYAADKEGGTQMNNKEISSYIRDSESRGSWNVDSNPSRKLLKSAYIQLNNKNIDLPLNDSLPAQGNDSICKKKTFEASYGEKEEVNLKQPLQRSSEEDLYDNGKNLETGTNSRLSREVEHQNDKCAGGRSYSARPSNDKMSSVLKMLRQKKEKMHGKDEYLFTRFNRGTNSEELGNKDENPRRPRNTSRPSNGKMSAFLKILRQKEKVKLIMDEYPFSPFNHSTENEMSNNKCETIGDSQEEGSNNLSIDSYTESQSKQMDIIQKNNDKKGLTNNEENEIQLILNKTCDESIVDCRNLAQTCVSTQPEIAVVQPISDYREDAKRNKNTFKGRLPPPKPKVYVTSSDDVYNINWDMKSNPDHSAVEFFQLLMLVPSGSQWITLGYVRPLPLPMSCTLTKLTSGLVHHFTVRGVDIHNRFGEPSEIVTITVP